MSEEWDQIVAPQRIGKYEYYRIGATTLNQLMDQGVIPKKDYDSLKRKRPDGIILYHKEVKAIVESKQSIGLNTEAKIEKAINQEIEVARSLCKLLIVTNNNNKTIWINALNGERIKGKNDNELKTVFSSKLINNVNELEHLIEEIDKSITVDNSKLQDAVIIDPTQLATRMWQTIWTATGKSPVKCLYNVVELFIFKFLSDLRVLSEDYGFEKVLKLANGDDQEALGYYARNTRPKIRELFPPSLLDGTTIINGTIFVNENGDPNLSQSRLFKKSLSHLRDFGKQFGTLTKIDKNFKTKLYETFLNQEVEAMGQYFTPRKIVQSIIRISGLDDLNFQYEGKRICDPFCGVGGFPLEILNMNEKLKNRFIPVDGKINLQFVLHGFDKGFEREDERTIILAKANMLIYLSDIVLKNPQLTQEFAMIFNNTFKLFQDNLGTFGHIIDKEEDKYDYILTNPPYVTSGSGIIKDEIKQSNLKSYYPINAMGLEGLSVEWIINSLKKNGKAFMVLPDGIFLRNNDEKLRDFILKSCYLNGIISLPIRTFFNNFRKTYILCLTKKENINDSQNYGVFCYLVSNIGEKLTSVSRENINADDLPEMEELYKIFSATKKEERLKQNPESLRCKIFPISKFSDSNHWSIDKWWSEEEKFKLGITEEKKTATPMETIELIDASLKLLNEYRSFLQGLENV